MSEIDTMSSTGPTAYTNSPPIALDSPLASLSPLEADYNGPTKEASNSKEDEVMAPPAENPAPAFEAGPRFWAIMVTLCIVGLLAAFENTVVATSLPFIVEELSLGENYIWITNAFFLIR